MLGETKASDSSYPCDKHLRVSSNLMPQHMVGRLASAERLTDRQPRGQRANQGIGECFFTISPMRV